MSVNTSHCPDLPPPSSAHSQGECRKLAFEAIRVTSQDAAHPVKNINDVIAVPGLLPGGWQTPPFPDYPQDIDIQFYGGECRVRAVHMLMHEFKLPSRVEAYAGRCREGQQPDVANAEWKFLGYVSFAPKPGGNARELKVIQVNAVGSFFRLRFVGFADHPRNLTNQVALVSLAVMGSIHVPRQQREAKKLASLSASGGETIDLSLLQIGVDVMQVTSDSSDDSVHPAAQKLAVQLKVKPSQVKRHISHLSLHTSPLTLHTLRP